MNQPPSNSNYVPDHVDYKKRVLPLRRRHPERTPGEASGNVPDARGDESLYKPSQLGRAYADIQNVRAGDNVPFALTYTAGPRNVEAGTRIKFFMPGQGPLGTAPQLIDPTSPGYIEPHVQSDAEVEPFCDPPRIFDFQEGELESNRQNLKKGDIVVGPVSFGFDVKKGALKNGEEVTLSLGQNSGFHWKQLAGRKEFKIIFEPPGEAPRMRLPEPVVIRILPLAPEGVEIFGPPTYHPHETLRFQFRIYDKYDNRVPLSENVNLQLEEWGASTTDEMRKESVQATLCNGIGHYEICSGKGGRPFEISVKSDRFKERFLSNSVIPAQEVRDDGLSLFIGDMHAHDSNSTAEGYPADLYHWARDEKRLDFLSVPLQVHRYIDNEKWVLAKHMAEYFLEENRFVTFPAMEWQHSHYGDKVAHFLGGDAPYLPIDDPRTAAPAGFYDALRETDSLVISHHPGYELDLHVPGTEWETVDTDIERLVEIWSIHGSSEGFTPDEKPLLPPRRPGGALEGLRKGVRIGFVGGSDTHTARPGGSPDDVRPYRGGLCAVWAEALTRRSLFEAFKARRTYALTGTRVVLNFTVNGHPMGAEIPFSRTNTLKVNAWAPVHIAKTQLLRNGEVIKAATQSGTVDCEDFWDGEGSVFYHCRVELENGDLAVASPVWVG